jgi:hypothetical protein
MKIAGKEKISLYPDTSGMPKDNNKRQKSLYIQISFQHRKQIQGQ